MGMLNKMRRRIGATFVVEHMRVRGIPREATKRTYVLVARHRRNGQEVRVQADGETCPYALLVAKLYVLAD